MNELSVDVAGARDVQEWRARARPLIAAGVAPERIRWIDPDDPQSLLGVEGACAEGGSAAGEQKPAHVPVEYLRVCERVLCHTSAERWDVLYRLLFRISRGERRVLADAADEDVTRARNLAKAVQRDAHKMKAFVRFRLVRSREPMGGAVSEHYVAWHRPDHRIVRLVAPFFARRFGVLNWTILTPFGSAVWDGTALTYGPGATRREAPTDDALEDLWRTYYASIFNPARVNPRAMQREMPVRYWATLPEASIIDELLRNAPTRVGTMLESRVGSERGAAAYLPRGGVISLEVLREAAAKCEGCAICENSTQTVFGEGPRDARIMLVGEQPGDMEDIEGRPFVGPAGQVLNDALAEAGLEREKLYVTNAVKHFKWTREPLGKRRIHGKPSVLEARACRPWLDAELEVVQPRVVVLLGSTAGQSLFGASFRVGAMRGKELRGTLLAPAVCVATIHPSAVLRMPSEEAKREAYLGLVSDLRVAGSVK